jgi:flagellar biosynthetic protein FliO
MFNPTELLKKWLATSSPRQKLVAALLVFSLLATGVFLSLGGSSETSGNLLDSTPLFFLGVFVKLVGVLLLIVASAVIFRRWSSFSPTGRRVRHLRLIETVRLSPKQSLHLVSVGSQQLLIGATDQAIALITPVEVNLESSPVEASQTQPVQDFASLLQTFHLHASGQPDLGKE